MIALFLLLAAAAMADPEAVEPESDGGAMDVPAGTVDLPDADPLLPSALDDDSPVALPGDAGLKDVIGYWRDQERDQWSAGNFIKPTLALDVTPRIHPVSLGVQLGRRWWQLRDGPAVAFAIQGSADFALAQGKGSYDLSLAALAGPWVKVIGLQLGPGIGTNRWSLGPDSLAPATGIDAVSVLILDLKVVHLFGGLTPRWLVAGDRAPAGDHNPLGLGDELAVNAGAGLTLGKTRFGLGWTRRYTALDPIDRYALSMRFRLL